MAIIPLFNGIVMIYFDICSLSVCQMNIYWDKTHTDVDWRQFDIKNAQAQVKTKPPLKPK